MYFIMMNTFVHVVMYSYYLLSIWRPDLSIMPKLKKTVTQIQLVSGFKIKNNLNDHMGRGRSLCQYSSIADIRIEMCPYKPYNH